MPVKTAAELLRSLESILFETTRMLDVLETARDMRPEERREMKQSVLELRERAQQVFDRLRH